MARPGLRDLPRVRTRRSIAGAVGSRAGGENEFSLSSIKLRFLQLTPPRRRLYDGFCYGAVLRREPAEQVKPQVGRVGLAEPGGSFGKEVVQYMLSCTNQRWTA